MITIEEISHNLSTTDKAIIEKVNKNPEIFIDTTIQIFARKVSASTSKISKFVRRIGFKNYREFQNYIGKTYAIKKGSDYLDWINQQQENIYSLRNYEFHAINETVKSINFETIENFIGALNQAKKIWVIGSGNSFLAAKDLSNALTIIGFVAFSTNDVFGSIHHLNLLKKNDLLIFVSERYSQKEYHYLARKLRAKKVKIAVITAVNKFFITEVDFVINFFAFPKENRPTIVGNVKIQQFFVNNFLINEIIKKNEIVIDWDDVMKW